MCVYMYIQSLLTTLQTNLALEEFSSLLAFLKNTKLDSDFTQAL
jgi:hypothetical protein